MDISAGGLLEPAQASLVTYKLNTYRAEAP